jgi:hypothetical protein
LSPTNTFRLSVYSATTFASTLRHSQRKTLLLHSAFHGNLERAAEAGRTAKAQAAALELAKGGKGFGERRQLQHLVEFYPELKVGYAQIVTISTDGLLATNEFRDGLGAQWPFLLDPERIVQKDLDPRVYRPAP